MRIELRFFASFREVIGQKFVTREFEDSDMSIGDLLVTLTEEHPDLELFDAEGDLRGFVSVLKNGRDITFLDGLDTALDDGDVVSIFPPVAGGNTQTIERTFRGISPRIAIEYLSALGGSPIDDSTVDGEDWRARISDETVEVGPTLTVTEVTIRFEGEDNTVDPLVEAFAQKAMRAGG